MSGIAKLYAYMAVHNIDVLHSDDTELIIGIVNQINAGMIEATPELIDILENIENETENTRAK